jgi:hypothetical protein
MLIRWGRVLRRNRDAASGQRWYGGRDLCRHFGRTPMTKPSAGERAARALCALEGQPPNIAFEGAAIWKSYLPEVRTVLEAIRDPGVDHGPDWERVLDEILAAIESG